MPKSAVKPINNTKNKLNSEIILIFPPNPNVHLIKEQVYVKQGLQISIDW